MALSGTRTLGPDNGTLQVRTYREGVAQRVGHDLIIDVGRWQATVGLDDEGVPSTVALEADARSLRVREGRNGLKPLSDKDRGVIIKNVDDDVLRGQPIAFQSSAIERSGDQLTVRGELTMAGTTRPAEFTLERTAAGRVAGTVSVVQSEWGIKPYRGLLGALRVRDAVEVVFDITLPGD